MQHKKTKYLGKMVAWDADYYKSLPSTDCIVCMTKQQLYLVGQIIDQLKWYNTRWIGDITGLDFDGIAGDLEERIASNMPCEQLYELITLVQQLGTDHESILVQLSNIINGTDYQYQGGVTIDTSIYSIVPYDEFNRPLADISPASCSTNDDKDKVWGACNQLARYMVQRMTDFIESLVQSAQWSENLELIIRAIPLIETLPFDELAGLTDYLVNQARETWDATVTEERINDLACLFYCFAFNNNNCKLSLHDVTDLLNAEMPTGIDLAFATLRDAIAWLVAGQFVGNDMFYALLGMELIVVGQGAEFLGTVGFVYYERQYLAGYNSPDSDWSIFCTDCSTVYHRLWSYDFTNGLDGWTLINGTVDSAGILGVDIGNAKEASVSYDFPDFNEVRAVELYVTRVDGVGNGSWDKEEVWVYNPPDSYRVLYHPFASNGDLSPCARLSPFRQANKILLKALVSDNATSSILITKIDVWFAPSSTIGTLIKLGLPC